MIKKWVIFAFLLGLGAIALGYYHLAPKPPSPFVAESDVASEKKEPFQLLRTDYIAGVYQFERVAYFANKKVEIISAPEGMEISWDKLSWKPDESSEGKTYKVVLKLVDDSDEEEITFSVKVVATRPIKKKIASDISSVIVSDEECGLSSLENEKFALFFRQGLGENSDQLILDEVDIEMFTSKNNYYIPPEIQQYSCLFRISNVKHHTQAPELSEYEYLYKAERHIGVVLRGSHISQNRNALRLYKLLHDHLAPADGDYNPKFVKSSFWGGNDLHRYDVDGLYFIGSPSSHYR